jgi:hypothetical protein
MKLTRWPLLIFGLIVVLIVNSCKKNGVSAIHQLFIGGTWQLASVTASYYTGNSLDSTKILNDSCQLTQFFTFTDNTCTYTNFDCISQAPPAAPWSLASNQLYLMANVVCQDTTAAKTSMPFSNAFIYNLGQFSLVLQTGDIQPNYSLTKKRKIIEYGFIRQKLSGTD